LELKSDIAYHGPMDQYIPQPIFHTRVAKAFLEAGKEMGYSLIDYNGKNKIGFSYPQITIMNNTRLSSNKAYLNPVRNRNNLHVTLESTDKSVDRS